MRKKQEQDESLPLVFYTRTHSVTQLYVPIKHRASLLQTATTVGLTLIGRSPHGCLVVHTSWLQVSKGRHDNGITKQGNSHQCLL